MTRRPGWAEKAAQALCRKYDYRSEPAIALAFEQEHARALRVVKDREKTTHTFAEPDAWTLGYRQACIDISEELKRGRT